MQRFVTRIAPYAVLALLILPLLAHLYLGQFVRASADDMCFTGKAQTLGMIGSLDWWYHNWTGTYSGTFYQNVVGLSRAWHVVPMFNIISWSCAALFTTYQLAALLKLNHRWQAATLLAFSFIYGIVAGSPNIFQGLYWTSGSIYTVSTIILTFNLGVVLHGVRQNRISVPHLVGIGCLSFIAGGFTPLFAMFQMTAFFLVLSLGWCFASRPLKRVWAAYGGVGLIFASIAMVILFVAPGNAIRREHFDLVFTLPEMLMMTVVSTLLSVPTLLGIFLSLNTFILLFLGVVIGVVYQPLTVEQGDYFRRTHGYWVALTVGVGLLLTASAFLVAVVSIATLPPERAYMVIQSGVCITLIALGYFVGLKFQNTFAQLKRGVIWLLLLGFCGLLLFNAVKMTHDTLALAPDFRVFAEEWEARDQATRAAIAQGQTVITVQPLSVDIADYMRLARVEEEPGCFKEYYQIEHVEIGY